MKITKINKLDKKGELVYVPSQTFLSNRIGVKVTSQLQKVEEPGIFLVLGEEGGSYEVKGEKHDHQIQGSL